MSNYDDPRWYEQHPEHNDNLIQQPASDAPITQQPPYSEYSTFHPYQAPGDLRQRVHPQESLQATPQASRRRGFGFVQSIVVVSLLLVAFAGG